MRTSAATSTDVADQIDQALAEAERQTPASGAASADPAAASAADISSQLLPPLSSAQEQDERFDVNARGVPASSFFEALVEGTRYNVVVHPGVTTPVDLRLSDVNVPEVMEIAADLYGLDIQRNGRLFRVAEDRIQTRLFPIDYLHFKRRGGSETRVSSGQVSSARGSGNGTSNSNSNSNTGNETRNLVGTTISTDTESDFWRVSRSAPRILAGCSPPR
ncbi:secretin N-terminal domain-containing protein [Marinobacter shengliensis]|nr:secretin N-terminal domain-containing protein [Marinobacter shengliensis]